ncbi:class I SAM-dependent methyltransferase [Cohnella yongneupensis]|uniref:Class I SAM-dependent methyltransferase n=1 Tax=Cohnella yongneupensis TaxID=425006 RepID=A0ABW0QYH8_9BACL
MSHASGHDKEQLRQSYNKYAEQRDQSKMEPWKFEVRQQFLQSLLENDGNSILELGAGPGRDGLYFQEHRFEVVCVDLSDEMVRLCKDKGLDARQMDVRELQFEEGQFDSVYAMNSLLHVPKSEIGGVLANVHRVLKPGGLFFYGVYGGESSEGVWEGDSYEPKRFFAMYADEELKALAQPLFSVEEFYTVPMGEGAPHFQSLLLRKQ